MDDPQKCPHLEISGLTLVDNTGRRRATIGLMDEAGMPSFRLYDSNQRERIVIGLDKDDTPHFAMLRGDAKALVGVGVDGRGNVGMTLYDLAGNIKVIVQASDADGGAVMIYDAKGECVWAAPPAE